MRYIPVTEFERKEMLKVIGKGIEELFEAIPDELKKHLSFNFPPPLSELEVRKEVKRLENSNKELICFAGGGVYDHYIPSVIDHIIRRPEFYTAYTPYQAEVSQGTLQAMYEYQSMICELAGMDISNASIYDGATALAEAVYMAITGTKREKVIISEGVNPHYLEVIKTYLAGRYQIELIPLKEGITDPEGFTVDDRTVGVVIQHPNYLGNLEEVSKFVEKAHDKNALAILSFDPISLGILKTPGEFDVDIATAEGQSLGLPMSLGGPHLGIFTAKEKFIRKMPGRISGKTIDHEGRIGFVMALQTREQHIRRESATSNICTNQQLCALTSALYLAAMGGEGIREVASQTTQKSHYLANQLEDAGFELPYNKKGGRSFFREFVVLIPYGSEKAIEEGLKEGFLMGIDLGKFRNEWKNHLLIGVTEKRTADEMDRLVEILIDH
jgi:glycine dehydrogenase subunit 1